MQLIIKTIIVSFCLTTGIFAQSNAGKSLDLALADFYNDIFFESCSSSIKIFDITDSTVLYSKASKKLLNPASNLKIFTSIAGLKYLSPDYNFQTQFGHTGYIKNDTLFGDIFINGGFDPLLTIEDFNSISDTLRNLNVKHITGSLIANVSMMDSLYWGEGWMWDDAPENDSPYLSPLIVNKSAVEVIVRPKKINEKPEVRLNPQSNYYSFLNNCIVTNEDTSNFKVTRDWVHSKNNITVIGDISISKGVDTTFISMVDPVRYFLHLFKQELNKTGISLDADFIINKNNNNKNLDVFMTIEHSLFDVINQMNKESDNLNAEMVLRTLSKLQSEDPSSAENGIKVIARLVKELGYNPKSFKVADGSGLSRYNLISVDLINSLLNHLYFTDKKLFDLFYSTLPIAGIDGTLADRFRKSILKNNLRAKTGTMSGVSALSGYFYSSTNHLISFSIIFQNYTEKSKIARMKLDHLIELVYLNL